LNYEAFQIEKNGSINEIHIQSMSKEKLILYQFTDVSLLTLNGVVYSTAQEFVAAFNAIVGSLIGIGGRLTSTVDVTLAGGGSEVFSGLTKTVGGSGAVGYQLVDTDILADCTVNMEISFDGTNWQTMTDSAGDDVTGVLSQSGQLQFPLVDIPSGASIRPKFVTDTTGDLVVTIIG
jgi:hypothetical protein